MAATMNSLAGYELTNIYPYTDAVGNYLFEKRRYEPTNLRKDLRKKTFRYFDSNIQSMRKPEGADAILYRLPELLGGVKAGRTIHWAEGEKDADALIEAGEVATSVHQGACKTTQAQADWLRDATAVVLWVDKDVDHWEVGAYDAVLRHNLLIRAGVEAERIRFVKARAVDQKDAFDHLQRFTVAQASRVLKSKLAATASKYTPALRAWAGYIR